MLQAIIYSKATGRVRRVIDPAPADPGVGVGEAVLLYTKQSGANRLHEWQAAVTLACGKVPTPLHPSVSEFVAAACQRASLTPTSVLDRYVAVDADGAVLSIHYCDPACGDSIPGATLHAHATADERWSFASGGLRAPLVMNPKSGKLVTLA